MGDNITTISFPVGSGVTSEVISKSEIRVSNTHTHSIFNHEIDNVGSKSIVEDFIFVPIFGRRGNLIAVLQLLNKVNKNITEVDDIEKLKKFAMIYGLIIERVNEKEKVINIFLEFKSVVTSKELIEENEKDMEINKLANSIKNLSKLSTAIIKHKNSIECYLNNGRKL